MIKSITILTLCFTAGAMIAHAMLQPVWNEIAAIEEQEEAYRNSAIIGWVMMDCESKQLYFEEKK